MFELGIVILSSRQSVFPEKKSSEIKTGIGLNKDFATHTKAISHKIENLPIIPQSLNYSWFS